MLGPAMRRGRGPNRQVWEGTRIAADGFKAQSKIEPQESLKGEEASAVHSLPTRTRFDEAD
ncbi:MAG TPA: hypothetical protein VLG49_05180 [Rhabdochlamydiaceae bacterium]|nr:hypothetical protein [Rhabdochlamydiaceae bacterium]